MGRVVDLTDAMVVAMQRKAPSSMRLAFARQRNELKWRRALAVAAGLDDVKPSMLLPRDQLGIVFIPVCGKPDVVLTLTEGLCVIMLIE